MTDHLQSVCVVLDGLFRCRFIDGEKWRCGKCLKGIVKVELACRCKVCGAVVAMLDWAVEFKK